MTIIAGTEAERRAFTVLIWKVTLVIAVLCTVELTAILVANGGHFSYSFDDPYIHLALAQEIVRGHYGINVSEPAAASSSIVYPFLLAAFVALGCGQFAALIVNVAAAFAVGALICGLFAEARLPVARLPRLVFGITAVILGINLVPIVFSGLEHTLHVADTLACLWGLKRFLDRRRVPLWWIAALIAAPLIRYEGASLLAAGMLVLLCRGEWKWAAVAGVIGFGIVGAFSLFLVHLGLPPLPSSVLVHSNGAASGVQNGLSGFLASLVVSFGQNIQDPRAVIPLTGLLLAAWPFIQAAQHSSRPSEWSDRALFGLFCVLVILAHLALGAFGWFARYETYLLVLVLASATVLYRDVIAERLSGATAREATYVILAFMMLFVRNVAMMPATIGAANNIYEQQYQMHRFVTEFYREPVAVNDLGWVSFDNDAYVLDLYGLGSDAARKARVENPASSDWMNSLTLAHDVRLAMIYPEWFPSLPCGWVHLGELYLHGLNISAASDRVSFFALPPGDPDAIRAKLKAFAASLPEGVRFVFAPLDEPRAVCASPAVRP